MRNFYKVCYTCTDKGLCSIQLDGLFLEPAVRPLREAMENLRALQCEEPNIPQTSPPPVEHSGSIGRPRFHVPHDQLTALVESGFTGVQIAGIVGVSLSTIRRMAQFGISVTTQYSHLSDESLDQIVMTIKEQFPTCGNKQMQGHLQSRGYRIQQTRVWESIMRVDPAGSMMQRLKALNRRQYCVPGPLSLWHMDSNHKPIRYDKVIATCSAF